MSSHASDSEVTPVRLADILTIGQQYKASILSPPPVDKALYEAESSLLERISIYQGDITKLEIDSIVNAANKSLLGGGGGRTLNGCMTGDAKITRGYELPSRYVIHTVGPIYSSNDVEEKARQLASCYRTSLKVAAENEARHIAFPSVSTGVYGYPIRDATRIALNEVRRFVGSELGQKLDRVIFVVWSNKDFDVYNSLVPEYFPPVQEQPKVTDNVADAESKKVEAEVPKAETAEAEEGERASDKMKAEQVGRPDSKED